MDAAKPIPAVEAQAGVLAALLDGVHGSGDRLARLVSGLQVRLVTYDARESVARLRYRAYSAAGAIGAGGSGAIWEDCDADTNARTFAVEIDGQPVATIRVHVALGEGSSSPACIVFPEMVVPWLAEGRAIIDSSCFCVEPELARRFPQLALVAVRIPVVLAQAFAPSWLIATPRRGHEGFYMRNFGGKRLANPRPYPGRERPLALVGNRIELVTERIFRRYPAYRASAAEQATMRALYEGVPA